MKTLEDHKRKYRVGNQAEATDFLIRTYATALKDYFDEELPGRPYPKIAGGAVRDQFFGFAPKDIDIFFDVSGLDDEKKHDEITLLVFNLAKSLETKLPGFQVMEIQDLSSKDTEYERNQKFFSVYECSTYVGPAFQIISRDEDTPLLDSFDYSLVKAYFDIATMTYVYHPEFLSTLATATVVIPSVASHKRWNRFVNRHPEIVPFFIVDIAAVVNRPFFA